MTVTSYVVIGTLIAFALLGGLFLFRRSSLPEATSDNETKTNSLTYNETVSEEPIALHRVPNGKELLELSEDSLTEATLLTPTRPPVPLVPSSSVLSSPGVTPTPSTDLARANTSNKIIDSLRKGLHRSRAENGFIGRIITLIKSHAKIDDSILEPLEDVLLSSDVGIEGTRKLLASVRNSLGTADASSKQIWSALREASLKILDVPATTLEVKSKPMVILIIGVNGAGKTTTIGKLATKLQAEGRSVLLAAGDTFRAAAVQQLEAWGRRVGCEVIKGQEGADPASVVFDAVQHAITAKTDVVLVDTAGRLQTKIPLMDELRKISKTLGKAVEGAPHQTWLVVDATTGQNGLAQAREFSSTLPLSGVILTKLDGTAKGGIILSICDELAIPVRYVGIGERADDLHEFHSREFVEAFLGESHHQDAA